MIRILKITFYLSFIIVLLTGIIILKNNSEAFIIEGKWDYLRTNQLLNNGEETPLEVLEISVYPLTLEIKNEKFTLTIYDATIKGSIQRESKYNFKGFDITVYVDKESLTNDDLYIMEYNHRTNELRIEPKNSAVAYYFKRNNESI